ncbi:MAG: hypothetical protein AAFU03_00105 [Bacteroidota bacterium]
MRTIFLVSFLLLFLTNLSAQQLKLKDLVDIQSNLDAVYDNNLQTIHNLSRNRTLIEPRQLKPQLRDMELIYFNPQMTEGRIRLIDGKVYAAPLRYRIFDQVLETEMEDISFAIDESVLSAFSIGNDNFVVTQDPMGQTPGRTIHQVHFVNDYFVLLEKHEAEESYSERLNNIPSSHSQLVRRKSKLILVNEDTSTIINGNNDVFEALRLSKKGWAGKYVKENKLKLKKGADLAALLKYISEKKGLQ